MQETWETQVWSLGQEDPLEEGMATHSSILAWRIPMDRGVWQATVDRVTKSQRWLKQLTCTHAESGFWGPALWSATSGYHRVCLVLACPFHLTAQPQSRASLEVGQFGRRCPRFFSRWMNFRCTPHRQPLPCVASPSTCQVNPWASLLSAFVHSVFMYFKEFERERKNISTPTYSPPSI